jgi:transcriptional regulator GlxA family with amidase domain
VARKTTFAGFAPKRRARSLRRHLVAVVVFDGVVLGDLATPCELFGRVRDAAGRAPYEVRICSIAPAVSSEHVRLEAPWRLSCLRRADTVIVPGVDDVDRPIPEALLARRHPMVEVDADVLYVDNGNVLTSAGAAAGLDLCLHLVRRDFGAEVAAQVARAAVMPLERAGGQAQFIVHEPPPKDGASIAPLLGWLEGNLRKHLPLPVIARHAGMSTRTLSRRFREQVGTTPALWVTRARVRRAQRLLETTDLPVELVAAELGFGSSALLREHFGRIVGTSPQAYRRSFRLT